MQSPNAIRSVLAALVVVLAACSSDSGAPQPAARHTERPKLWISEVREQDPATRIFLGSPSILRLTDGAILVTHDWFGPEAPKNEQGDEYLTSVYRSEDDGRTWECVDSLRGQFWSGLFAHRNAAYLLGTSAHDRDIAIRRSTDGGRTWTEPADETSGLLFPAGVNGKPPRYHTAATPAIVHGGRIWRAFQRSGEPGGYRAIVISADEDDDLLDARSWRMSEELAWDPRHNPPDFGPETEWLEGNVVIGLDEQVYDFLRLNTFPALNRAALVRVLDDGRRLAFDPDTGIIAFPAGSSKFTVRRDPITGTYWTIGNDMQERPVRYRRNRLSLFSSYDLRTWTKEFTLLVDDRQPDPDSSAEKTGFQHVDWQFDSPRGKGVLPGYGDDIMYVIRAAYDGARDYRESNRIVYGRVRNFRDLLRGEPAPAPLASARLETGSTR